MTSAQDSTVVRTSILFFQNLLSLPSKELRCLFTCNYSTFLPEILPLI
jgi:hypothetical protein